VAVLRDLTSALARRDGVLVLGPLGFENAYALAMRADRAKALGIATIVDLAARAPQLSLGSDLEFLSRPEWTALQRAYGLKFRKETSYQPTFMYRALSDGEADVISAFSSDGRIAADHLVVLADPRHALPPYDAVILVSPRRAHDARLLGALKPLIGAIPVGAMRAANYAVDRDTDKLTPAQAARALARPSGG
jgi:osmoprotectant transport system permease protein